MVPGVPGFGGSDRLGKKRDKELIEEGTGEERGRQGRGGVLSFQKHNKTGPGKKPFLKSGLRKTCRLPESGPSSQKEATTGGRS